MAVARLTDANFSAQDVWVFDLEQHTRTRLTFDTTAGFPLWTPDGRRIAYSRAPAGLATGSGAIYWVPADGSGAPESLVTAAGQWVPRAFAARRRD